MATKKTSRKNPKSTPRKTAKKKTDKGKGTSTVYKQDKYLLFLQWSGMPYPDKVKEGVATQKDFAAKHGINEDTLTNWKKRKDYDPKMFAESQKWARERWANVMGGLYTRALKGYALEVELYLMFAFGWTRDAAKEQATKPPVSEEDIFEMAQYLEPDKKKELYGKIAEIVAEARIARDRANNA